MKITSPHTSHIVMPSTQIHRPRLYVSLSLLMGMAFAASTFSYLGFLTSLVVFIITAACNYWCLQRAFVESHQLHYQQLIANILAAVGGIIFLILLFTNGRGLALLGLLFFLQLALSCTLIEHRQVYYALMIAFSVLLFGIIMTRHAGFVIYIIGFGLCVILVFTALFIDQVEQQSTTFQPNDPIPILFKHQWIFILLLILGSTLLYLLMPRFPPGNIGQLPLAGFGWYDADDWESKLLESNQYFTDIENLPTHTTSDTRKPIENATQTASGTLAQQQPKTDSEQIPPPPSDSPSPFIYEQLGSYDPERLLLYVKANEPQYLRLESFDFFDGLHWQRLHQQQQILPNTRQQFHIHSVPSDSKIEIEVVSQLYNSIPAPFNAVELYFPARTVAKDWYEDLFTSQALKANTHYAVGLQTSTTPHQSDQLFRAPSSWDTQLPDLNTDIHQLMNKIVAEATTDYEKATLLENYLRQHYQYTLETISQQNTIPLHEFLFTTKKGHCEYFATAMAVGLRTLGIPSRLIQGFAANELNPVTGLYEVRAMHAHAWVEGFIDGRWMIFEATPAYPSQIKDYVASTQTHQQLKTYLQQQMQHESRKMAASDWKSFLRTLWHQVLMSLTLTAAFIEYSLPYVIIFAIALGVMSWVGYKIYQRYQIRWQDWRALRQMKRYQPTHTVADWQFYLQTLQNLLARHHAGRETGETIEVFINKLSRYPLSPKVLAQLAVAIDSHYYQETPPALLPFNELIQEIQNLYQYFHHPHSIR